MGGRAWGFPGLGGWGASRAEKQVVSHGKKKKKQQQGGGGLMDLPRVLRRRPIAMMTTMVWEI